VINSIIDTLLDRTVLPGYTRLGYELRRRTWRDGELQDMSGRTVLVSGATSGLGRAAAEGFARLGASVELLSRDRRRGEDARQDIAARSGNEDVHVGICDLGDLGSVRAYAQGILARGERIDVLVNNAGVLLDERKLSPDGVELTFATNVLGPFLLSNLLSARLGESPSGRIINVSSGGMYTQRIHVDDLQMENEDFDGTVAYARSKRAQVILTELWAPRLAPMGVSVHAMHPGWADTPGLQESLPGFYNLTKRLLRDARAGADTILWLGSAPAQELGSGGFWHDRRRRPAHRVPWTHESETDRARLWAECARLSGWAEHEEGS
jgi:dehydrogenase/reductase SDR family protein 12